MGKSTGKFRHILVATDGTRLAARACRRAIELAKAEGATLTAFHAIPAYVPLDAIDPMMPMALPYATVDQTRATKRHAQAMLDKVAEEAKAAGVECDTASAQGEVPWRAILAAAKKHRCDLIVMASHGRSGIDKLLLGSETSRVLTHAKLPVLVCR